MDFPGDSAADLHRDARAALECDSETDSCGDSQHDFPADSYRDWKADSRRDLRRDFRGDLHGHFDGALRVEAEDEEPKMEDRGTRTGGRTRTARTAGGWFASYAEGVVAGLRLKRASNRV